MIQKTHNTKRPHQGIEHLIPMTKYAKIAKKKKKISNYLLVPQRMITFAAPKERDSGSLLPVVLPAECM